MIKFALLCPRGHEFESWFQNGEAFEKQVKSGHVLCPRCQAADVTKAIMAPAVASKNAGELVQHPAREGSHSKAALTGQRELELRAMITAFRRRIFEEAEDVGLHFPEEARKIHDGLAEERPIHSQAKFDDARALLAEGIAILPVPPLPDEMN